MRLRAILCLPCAGLAALACAGIGAHEPIECAPGTAGVPLAFELRAPSGARAFLQGSVHLAQDQQATLDPRALEALRQAKVLVSEVDMRELTQEDVTGLMLELGSLPAGERMQDRLSPEAWNQLSAKVRETGADPEVFQPFEPWVAALSLMGLSLMQAGFSAEEGVELQLYSAERPQETRGLESIQDQLELFDHLDREAQEVMLIQTLEPTEQSAAELNDMFAAWHCGDDAALDRLMQEMVAEDPRLADFYEATIFQRNVHMADGVRQVLGEVDDAFVVVGALHLVGARGIPALLQSAGYEVRQLRSEPAAPAPPR